MQFLVTGATGLIGNRLTEILLENGHGVSILTRRNQKSKNNNIRYFNWNPEKGIIDKNCLDNVEIVINLAGSPIAQLWTKKSKKSIVNSRVSSVKLLEKLILNHNKNNIKLFVCASAIGIYPSNMNVDYKEQFNEYSKTFLGNTVKKWEDSCLKLEKSKIPVVKLRIGLVLSMKSGLLKPIVISTKFLIATWIGKGKNFYSWIHIEDVVRSIYFICQNNLSGVYNLVAPNPVSSKNFMIEVSKKIKRPLILPSIPEFLVKTFFGKMSELFLFDQKVNSHKIMSKGFKFKFNYLTEALDDLIE